jgi:2-oxoglutarate/2-oxoacid ferredoxin oxidoreductase subunit alpha
MNQPHKPLESISFVIVGTGGAGAITAGSILLEAAGRAGYYGLLNRLVGPQIRGGEAAALVRLAVQPTECMTKEFDILVAIDWKNSDRFISDMPTTKGGLVVTDPAQIDVPDAVAASGVAVETCALKEEATDIPGGRENMIAVGLIAHLIGLTLDIVMDVVTDKLAKKGAAVVAAGRTCILAGMSRAAGYQQSYTLKAANKQAEKRWLITGNEAVGMGAVRGGVRFAAAYPITPATEVLEWLAPSLANIGGALVQAEDELSSINMIIGASFGGRPAITATSGPGLALMMESLGLAAASEVPIVVVDVMRCGPSTGIATKSEQSDLNIAVYGLHGDAPHVVEAPLSVADCLFTTQWAVHMAEMLQTPVIVLSDQSIGQARVLIERPAEIAFIGKRRNYEPKVDEAADYMRYALTADGISPMSIPGTKGGQYTADGLTHSVRGTPSSKQSDQKEQMDKRRDKISNFDFGDHWGVCEGNGDIAILVWGSMTGAAREAQATLKADGIQTRLVAIRQISPFPVKAVEAALEGVKKVLLVEQNHEGQFYRHARSFMDLPPDLQRLNREGPYLIGPDEIANHINEWIAK